MLPEEQNILISRTGPGTPCGDLMRRYWQPVALSKEITSNGKPVQLHILGENLVLFRDEAGQPGLLGLHCSHRRTSLAYGRVEDGGIRCPFHGWLYDVGGHCLEQPAEPEGSTFKDKIRHPAYPCQEMGGMVFAYMGPSETMPLLPRYEILVRTDGSSMANYYYINSNYLQNVEGALDTIHFSYLHTDNWSALKGMLAGMPKPTVEFAEADFGIWQKSSLPNPARGEMSGGYAHFFMPAGFLRLELRTAWQDQRLRPRGDEAAHWQEPEPYLLKFQSWYVPVDDTHTKRFQAAFAPLGQHERPYDWPEEDDYLQPGPENDYFRDYETYDTISGIPCRAPGTAIKGFLVQDNMVNESQGPIVERSQEHLGAHDHVLTAMRRMYLKAIEDVQAGHDPKHVIRDPACNELVYVAGGDELERM